MLPDLHCDSQAIKHFVVYGFSPIGCSSNAESMDRASGMIMQKKIVELSSQLRAAEDRERQRDHQFVGMKAQLVALLASGDSPCPDDACNQRLPPPPSQSRAQCRVSDQKYQLRDEPTSGQPDALSSRYSRSPGKDRTTRLLELDLVEYINCFEFGRWVASIAVRFYNFSAVSRYHEVGKFSEIQTYRLHEAAKGVELLLSIGSGVGNYYLNSTEGAREVATYLRNNYLEGNSSSRLLGDAVLDGIDFDIEGGTNEHWDDLARFLGSYNKLGKSKVYLSAAPQYPFPDAWGIGNLEIAWKQWTSVTSKRIFLGLPAAAAAGGSGFIPADDLTKQVLPAVKASS
ncbi:hypothetical protein RND71_035117 [Anisodus tanguticus]|uniref:chitinase n=1 Tax=Anisodus tanguticus TaxID=243964 RepID=A0AAE1R4E3_9SOLA|nr:hypothetical protein RND71_035117 [Anisodus tanguticus]